MKIALISDTHLNITTKGQLKKLFKSMKSEKFDIIVHAGDYSGASSGAGSVLETVKLMRIWFPDTPIVSVLGNHDYWCGKPASLLAYQKNLDKIHQVFKDHNIHFLDENGPYVNPKFPNVKVLGYSGWYANSNPPTNDQTWLPSGIEGHTHNYMAKRANRLLEKQLQEVNQEDNCLVFVSHFPVIDSHPLYGGPESIGNMLKSEYNCKYFLNGHSHKNSTGPLKWESGSDYGKPAYKIVEIING